MLYLHFSNRFLRIVASIFIALTLTNCSKSSNSVDSNNKLTIAVIPKGSTHEFWRSIHAGALKAGNELGVEIVWKGPLKEDDREEQIKVVEDFITRGVSGIVLAPLDETALRPVVTDASRSDIPVVVIDSGLKGDDYVSYVATDNYQGGKLAGEYLANALGGRGRVAMLRYAEGSNSTMERERGFIDAIKTFSDIELVSSNQYSGVTTEGAYRAAENLLAPLKTSDGEINLDGIFAPCEPVTFGILRALQDSSLVGKVKLVGFDSTEKMAAALETNQVDALVLQDPVNMGYKGVVTLVEHLRGRIVDKRIDTGSSVITRDTMKDPRYAELLRPNLSQWLK